ncbi:hypothetical protein K0M31_000512 [Melipona bicolor]|uniref:T-box domain-containing protein n=1 Tax=Melipona bicolor TaxID=60889 RepID=A0AA40GF03_9HYME|nr:hypothetical protein K0M31_000512 [Melipona bicolor]
MNLVMPMPMELQLRFMQHQQMFFRHQKLALRRHRTEDRTNLVPTLRRGPSLSAGVSVELQNRELWQKFHAETTEMVITKGGRRMFPLIQLKITGLERRARYCVVLEMEPASDRRHKYVGCGGGLKKIGNAKWSSAGPAETQPRFDRRIYLHPDSPATGAHWMQQSFKFDKLKLTNNVADPKNNIVLLSMHKYVPRIWIICCDDAIRLSDLFSYPSSSFKFSETEFIAVTAYQNENITQLKINNNPFAKGFRDSGQSRCKRKLQEETEKLNHINDDGNASLEREINRSLNHLDNQRPTTASSETGSSDDSGVSSYEETSPLLSMVHRNPLSGNIDHHVQPKLHRPWIDSSPQYSSSTIDTSFSDLLPVSNFPSYFQLLYPMAMESDFTKLPYQSMVQFSKYD